MIFHFYCFPIFRFLFLIFILILPWGFFYSFGVIAEEDWIAQGQQNTAKEKERKQMLCAAVKDKNYRPMRLKELAAFLVVRPVKKADPQIGIPGPVAPAAIHRKLTLVNQLTGDYKAGQRRAGRNLPEREELRLCRAGQPEISLRYFYSERENARCSERA